MSNFTWLNLNIRSCYCIHSSKNCSPHIIHVSDTALDGEDRAGNRNPCLLRPCWGAALQTGDHSRGAMVGHWGRCRGNPQRKQRPCRISRSWPTERGVRMVRIALPFWNVPRPGVAYGEQNILGYGGDSVIELLRSSEAMKMGRGV